MSRHMSIGNRHGVVLKRKIFVGGVNPALGNDVLKKYFSSFGPVEDATIMRYSDGRSRGFGFVVFVNEATCTQVLQQRTHPVTAHDKVEVKPCLSRSKTRPIGVTGMAPLGSLMTVPPNGYDGFPHQPASHYKGMYGPYRGGGPPPPHVVNGPYGGYNSHNYSRCGYGGSRHGGCAGESSNGLGGYSTACGGSANEYSNYGGDSGMGSGMGSGMANGMASVPVSHATRPWMDGYRDESQRYEYWRDPYDPAYSTSEYYGQENRNSSGAPPPTAVPPMPVNTSLGPRVPHTSYGNVPPNGAGTVMPNAPQAGPSSSNCWMNRDGFFDMSSFTMGDARGAYVPRNPNVPCVLRHTSPSNPPTRNTSVSQGSVVPPMNMKGSPASESTLRNFSGLRMNPDNKYMGLGTTSYSALNSFQRKAPY